MRFARSALWSLSASQLAEQCQSLAVAAPEDPGLQREIEHLCAGWREAAIMNMGQEGGAARRAVYIAALRRRTIEILVRLNKRDAEE